MRPHRRALILAALVATLGGWLLGTLFRERSSDASPRRPAAARDALAERQPPASPIPFNGQAPQPASEAKAASIPNELLLAFTDAAAYQRFLEQAARSGLKVLSSNARLKAVRLNLASEQEARQARALAGQDARIENNYTVLIPLPVRDGIDYQGVPFEARALDAINAPSDRRQSGAGLLIAILDTGILPHPTLSGARIEAIDLVDKAGASSPINGHGTAVASLIVGQNGNGIAPAAKLLSVRVLDSDGIGDMFTVAEGIVAAADAGATVINLSLGGFGYSSLLEEAVRYAQSQGAVLVAAAGNEGASALPYPAQFEGVVSVAAIDATGSHAAFSNQGSQIDLAAPGVGVYAAWTQDNWISFTGTSAAAPIVAGAIASLSSASPDLQPEEAARRLMEYANDTGAPGFDSQTGHGYLDLRRVEESQTSGIVDLALADIRLVEAANGDQPATLQITAQNRGTARLSASYLEYESQATGQRRVYLGPLAPREVASLEIPLPPYALADASGLSFSATASPAPNQVDAHPENDRKSIRLAPAAPSRP